MGKLSTARRTLGATMLSIGGVSLSALAQAPQASGGAERWDVTQARGETREIDFTTSEGTWMSVDLSSDGRWIVFDLLGHVYRMPASGGEAEVLTQGSGVAVNFHPNISPDGRHIAFVSDRAGQNNLWVMDIDGANPRPVFTDLNVRVVEPEWTPDGEYIIVRRMPISAPGQPPSSAGIWMYHRDGGTGVELVGGSVRGAEWPSVSSDGRYMYFHASPAGGLEPLSGAQQLRRLELRNGEIVDISAGESQGAAAGRWSSGGAAAGVVSPDGRWLAFARVIPDGTISFKGHTYGPRTALWLRDLQSGAERILMDPITPQVASGSKSMGVLPRYAWAGDGGSIVLTQGGKIRRVDVETGAVTTIPFTARVRRTISEQAYRPFRISDDSLDSRFMRWFTASPDGRRLAFQAVGRIWVVDLPECGSAGSCPTSAAAGVPRRVTGSDFGPLEYSPAWSPDGQSLAFVTWDDTGRGQLWTVAVDGGEPRQITRDAGEYIHPVWSPSGATVVAARGAGATARGRTITHNSWFDLVSVPVTGGAANVLTTVNRPSGASVGGNARKQIARPSFGPDGRLFFPEEGVARGDGTRLVSVNSEGGDEQVHLVFPYADDVVPSPDGRYVAFQEGDNVYVTPMAYNAAGSEPVRVDKKRGKFPVTQLSTEGGLYPTWRDSSVLEFGSGTRFYAYNVDTERTDTVSVALKVARDVPRGTVALTGARIVTLNNREVIENGTIVVNGSRIACVGQCDTSGVERVIDAGGKTIIPGFIDMHSHHFREHRGMRPRRDYESAIYLAYGVTSNLDNSMWSQNIFPTAELIEAGEIIGPRAFSTGDPLYRGDAARQNDLTSYEVTEQNVRRLQDWGAVSIKQYQQPRRAQRQWVSHAARKLGLMVTAEGGDLMYNLSMVMDGQTGWEHPIGYVPVYGDVASFFGKAKAVYSPTFVVAGPSTWNIEYFFGESDLWKDPKQRRWLPWRMLVPHTRQRTLRPTTDYSYPLLAQGLADIIAEGGYGAIGSHGEHHGLAAHWEVWMAASALGAHGALEVASKHGAYFLGAEQDVGTIEVGKLADLIVLNSNPLDNIRNTTDMQYVVKGGRIYEADTLDEVWPRSRAFGPYYWVDEDAFRSDSRPDNYFDVQGAPP